MLFLVQGDVLLGLDPPLVVGGPEQGLGHNMLAKVAVAVVLLRLFNDTLLIGEPLHFHKIG